jgi:1-deoxy-D-xylulose-5-phosphate reductoisomerase
MKQNITILGSTGSIGKNAIQVIEEHKDKFNIFAISAATNVKELEKQIIKFSPVYAVMLDKQKAKYLTDKFKDYKTKILSQKQDLDLICSDAKVDIVLVAIVGSAALLPTLSAIKERKKILLTNKEALVSAGNIIMREANKNKTQIIPIDSEHNAIFQCLPKNKSTENIKHVTLTASGGPFLYKTKKQMANASVKEATSHPNWQMGQKISIDSATMMNKALEIIEAYWLFCLPADKIKVIVHPQSIVHSMVHFIDGSILAQMANADMKIPLIYGLAYPNRLTLSQQDFDLYGKKLEFFAPDKIKYSGLDYAYQALKAGGSASCILNCANEIAVRAFISKKIKLNTIFDCVKYALDYIPNTTPTNIQDVLDVENRTHIEVNKYIKNL